MKYLTGQNPSNALYFSQKHRKYILASLNILEILLIYSKWDLQRSTGALQIKIMNGNQRIPWGILAKNGCQMVYVLNKCSKTFSLINKFKEKKEKYQAGKYLWTRNSLPSPTSTKNEFPDNLSSLNLPKLGIIHLDFKYNYSSKNNHFYEVVKRICVFRISHA